MGIIRLFNYIEPENPTFISDNIASVKSKINYTVTPTFDIIEEKNTVGFHIVYYNDSTIKERNIELNTEKMIITYLEIVYNNDSDEEYDQIIISSKTIPPVIFEPSLFGEGSARPNTTNFPIFIIPVSLFGLYFRKKFIPK